MSSDEFGSPRRLPGLVWQAFGIPSRSTPLVYRLCIHPDQETFHWVRDFRYSSVRLMPSTDSEDLWRRTIVHSSTLVTLNFGLASIRQESLSRNYPATTSLVRIPGPPRRLPMGSFIVYTSTYHAHIARLVVRSIQRISRAIRQQTRAPWRSQGLVCQHLGFKRLFNAHRKTWKRSNPVRNALVWCPKYRGKALNEVYYLDRRYINWCADPKRASSTWREQRPYIPRARTELIRDTGDKCGPWDDDDRLKDDEYDTTDGFVEPDPDWEPKGWEDYEELEAQGYKEESDVEWVGEAEGDAIAGKDKGATRMRAKRRGRDSRGGDKYDKEEGEEEEEEEEASFKDGHNEATSSGVRKVSPIKI
ncbi:hypothetical protein IMY05_C4594000700 [Salix suchowensis]|nr:hypothetical protein IMY05_C4594000700 [Salix suchowensis]